MPPRYKEEFIRVLNSGELSKKILMLEDKNKSMSEK